MERACFVLRKLHGEQDRVPRQELVVVVLKVLRQFFKRLNLDSSIVPKPPKKLNLFFLGELEVFVSVGNIQEEFAVR